MSHLRFNRVFEKKSERIEAVFEKDKSPFCEVSLSLGNDEYLSFGKLISNSFNPRFVDSNSSVIFAPTFHDSLNKLVEAYTESVNDKSKSEVLLNIAKHPAESFVTTLREVEGILKEILLEVNDDKINLIFANNGEDIEEDISEDIAYSREDIRDVRENLFEQISKQYEYYSKDLVSKNCMLCSVEAMADEIRETVDSEIDLIAHSFLGEEK